MEQLTSSSNSEKAKVITQEFETRLDGTRTPEEVIELHRELYERLCRETFTPNSAYLVQLRPHPYLPAVALRAYYTAVKHQICADVVRNGTF